MKIVKPLTGIEIPLSHETQMIQVNSHTKYNEPQIWITFSDNTRLEITQEQNGLKEYDWYYTVRHHCTKEDFNAGKYEKTLGVMSSFKYATEKDLIDGLKIFFHNMTEKGIHIAVN